MYKFTAIDNFGLYEEFSGYDSIDDALEGQDRLETVGYSDFSFPEEEKYND